MRGARQDYGWQRDGRRPSGAGADWRRRTLRGMMLAMGLWLSMSLAAPAAARIYTGIVVDQQTGQVLYERRADREIYPASLTKMMTLYMLFDAMEQGRFTLDDRLKVSRNAAGKPRSKLGVKAGETIAVRDAILALMVKSANDVATVVAESLASSEVVFARNMTAQARKLGMVNTSFRNANGLPNRHQRSTARDLANLATALIRDFPQYYPLFSTETFTWKGRTYRSTNNLLGRYKGVDGLKTGFINASGYNLVTSAVRDGRRIVAVVIGGRTAIRRDNQMRLILDRGFTRLAQLDKQHEELQVAALLPPPRPDTAATAGQDGIALSRLRVKLISEAHAETQPTAPIVAIGDHGVQVGAFGSRKRALAGARLAVAAVPEMLRNHPLSIEPIKGRHGDIFRARLLAFGREEAEAACSALKDRSRDCLVVRTVAD